MSYNAQGEVPEQDMNNDLGLSVVNEGSSIRAMQFVVTPGENIVTKMHEFIDQHENQAMYVAKAKGYVSTLSIPNSSISGGVMTLQGHFKIISLSGMSSSKVLADGTIKRFTNLAIVVPDQIRGLVGGAVTGPLIAYSPVTIIMAMFDQELSRGGNRERNSGSGDANTRMEAGGHPGFA